MNAPLTVELDGDQVRLTDCTWVLWSPGGYPAGMSQADARTRTAAQAMRVLHHKPLQAALDGWRIELMTHDRWSRDVYPVMRGDQQATKTLNEEK